MGETPGDYQPHSGPASPGGQRWTSVERVELQGATARTSSRPQLAATPSRKTRLHDDERGAGNEKNIGSVAFVALLSSVRSRS
ncbi:hypothetical protein C0Q70_04096 [Pomacea canaliculata]|uniref:Uncharacterized protein n=1 Tax=Pomacea canaliculata TaxID=400727 RepID=A0A2T7PUJ7_POMCA|nr:hypothetical protein C0Q70_04096 [Pomacea canaliculata]